LFWLAGRIVFEETYIFELSPVISTHVGPGTTGVAVHCENTMNSPDP
jgi:fatty acid-binding protein DegV